MLPREPPIKLTENLMRHSGFILLALVCSMGAGAAEISVEIMRSAEQGVGKALGTVTILETTSGIEFVPRLSGERVPGPHGFHVHENPACGPGDKEGKVQAGLAAGRTTIRTRPASTSAPGRRPQGRSARADRRAGRNGDRVGEVGPSDFG